jgi:hypothetical protein
MTEAVRRKIDPDSLFTGLVLVAVGVAFLTGDFGHIVRDWWPMIVVLVGIPKLFHRRTIWAGLWLISIGAWLQLVRLHLFGLRYGNAWPLLLIVVGAGIALRALFDVTGGKRDES